MYSFFFSTENLEYFKVHHLGSSAPGYICFPLNYHRGSKDIGIPRSFLSQCDGFLTRGEHVINDTLDISVIGFYQFINWSHNYSGIRITERLNEFFNIYAIYSLYMIFLRVKMGFSVLIINCTIRWSPIELPLLLLIHGPNTEGAPTIMGFDYLEMTKSSVWPPLWVALLTCRINPC